MKFPAFYGTRSFITAFTSIMYMIYNVIYCVLHWVLAVTFKSQTFEVLA